MLHGYARVSTDAQELDSQRVALRGCDRVWTEHASALTRRAELQRMLYCLRAGDVVRVYKVDRVARSLTDLLGIVGRIERAGASIQSCTEPIDTSTPLGRLLLQMLGGFAEFERSVIVERCAAGIEAAKARGVRFGRPRSYDAVLIRRLCAEGLSRTEVARRVGSSPSTVSKLALGRY